MFYQATFEKKIPYDIFENGNYQISQILVSSTEVSLFDYKFVART